ncbi:tyrosine-type recombinase/integrase [Sulfurimonas sp.]|jgi:integrase|uniref:tyrosine-type recombinase/integrase n=1 Tax=Sulfurimonas sp. TaxID=2022749 RepID=UPI002A35B11C|nr:tyrosine-type recombinase/integrase [Sulfurimonas sp.]MDY0122962.1 tyrosine-type recombinase/integrase [Sulfurimonas sp.]
MKTNLTQPFVKRIECEAGKSKQEFYDKEIQGFILEVRATGAKSFFIRTTVNGKRTSKKIGDAKVMDIEAARVKAIKVKRALEEQKDIILGKSTKENKKPSVITLGAFYDTYYLPHIKKHIKSYETNISVFKNHILTPFKNIPMDKISKASIMKLHSDMVVKKKLAKATANKVLIFLSSAYNIAIELELEGITENPASKIKEFTLNNAKERYLTKEETKRLLEAINTTEQNIHLKYIVPMLLLTGARRGEVLKAKHEDFNLNQMTWTIPTTKNGKKRILPITPQLLELYNKIPKDDTPYLFTSPVTGKPYVSIYNSWNSARTKAGLKDVRIHDLRHSFASALVNNGVSLYQVQSLLGHSTSTMTQRYAHLSNESLMSAASCAGSLM